MAEVWQRVLGLGEIPAQGNFFDLGGHSLLAVQAHRELRNELGLTRLSIADVFGYPTLTGLAARIAEIGGAKPAARPRPEPQRAPPPANGQAEPRSEAPLPEHPGAAARKEAMARRREMRARRQAG